MKKYRFIDDLKPFLLVLADFFVLLLMVSSFCSLFFGYPVDLPETAAWIGRWVRHAP